MCVLVNATLGLVGDGLLLTTLLVDAKSDAIAFCVKTYPSGSFVKNRTNMHERQNRMKIVFCVKPLNLPFCLRIKGAHVKFSGGGGGSVGLAPALHPQIKEETFCPWI